MEYVKLYNHSGYCPHCKSKLEPQMHSYYDNRDMHHEGWVSEPTGYWYCPYCEEQRKIDVEKKQKEIEQKQYEEKVSKYENEYKDYLEIRELDSLYTLNLTMKEVEAVRRLINQNDRFKELNLHHIFKELNHIYLSEHHDEPVTHPQRKCINIIENNTCHKFYGNTLSSAKLFISKYIEESKGNS